ncbi:TorF family putative porin [Colwellia sp. E2M01]|uniref:TorF family putative porin n=1 Tax=Colwellia sp. E2M01 TaxID=2841561 RepID=UPI001C0A22E0|nr:TorF family putative porin [Colwellia sp. E2M01]MBU2870621.1 TorF family putative porin [Colwellia sp. E2M01]
MKKLTTAFTLLSLATSAAFVSTSASAEVSANVAATSNYLWRGMEQTGGAAAISGGIDYSAESGFYVGTWASNASWGDMKTELDLYGGFGADINENMSYDVGFIYYAYPDSISGDADFSEVYGSFTFSGLTLGVAVLTSGEDADAGDTIYASADYALALSNEAEVNFHIGSYSGDWLAEDSIDFGVSLSKDNFTFGVSKIDLDDGAGSDEMKFYVSYAVDITL